MVIHYSQIDLPGRLQALHSQPSPGALLGMVHAAGLVLGKWLCGPRSPLMALYSTLMESRGAAHIYAGQETDTQQ